MKLAAERRTSLLLFLVLLLGLGLRLVHLDLPSLWTDEAFTRFYSESPLSYLWTTGFRLETNPPLYYTVIHFWMQLFGVGETALRSFSVLASVLVLVLVYALGRELQNSTVGLVGTLIFALAPTEIWYAQEARTFALLQVFIGVALLALARFLSASGSSLHLAAYMPAAAAAVYCHNTALFFVIACNLAVLGAAGAGLVTIPPRKLVHWLAANAIVFLLILPLLLIVVGQVASPNLRWIPALTPMYLLRTIKELVGGICLTARFHYLQYLSILLLLATGWLLVQSRKLDRRSVGMLVLLPGIFFLLIVGFSFHKSILVARVLLWTWIPLSLLLAHLLTHPAVRRPAFLILTGLVLAIGLDGQLFSGPAAKDEWRGLLQQNQRQLAQADLIVVTPAAAPACFLCYLPSAAPRLAVYLPPASLAAHSTAFPTVFIMAKFQLRAVGPKELADARQAGKRVWLLDLDAISAVSLTPASLPPGYRAETSPQPENFHIFTCNDP